MFLNALFGPSINEHMQQADAVAEKTVLDVRSPEEFAQGHLPGAVNLPLDRIREAPYHVPNRNRSLFVYCLSGARSALACRSLAAQGYTNVTDMGGINRWRGPLEMGGNA